MNITGVNIKLVQDNKERLQAFCSVTFDNAFVVHDLKIIESTNGLFVAMPSHKLTSRCPKCGYKNYLLACFCNQCGGGLDENRVTRGADGYVKLYADTAHPITAAYHELIKVALLKAYNKEKELSKQPGYIPRYYG